MEITLITVLCSDAAQAKHIAQRLIDNRLVACANYASTTSMYVWDDSLQEHDEVVLTLKTLSSHASVVVQEIQTMHSYTTPYIASSLVQVSDAYAAWMRTQVKNPL